MSDKSSGYGKGSPDYGRGVSPERLAQRSGEANAFGGWAKIQKPDGGFTMKPTGDSK